MTYPSVDRPTGTTGSLSQLAKVRFARSAALTRTPTLVAKQQIAAVEQERRPAKATQRSRTGVVLPKNGSLGSDL